MRERTKSTIFIIGLSSLILGYAYFNRNDDRVIQDGIVSPSDGTVEKIEGSRIDIFIGLTDVHYQRAPIVGTITNIQDFPAENRNIITIDNKLSVERRGGMLARSVKTFVKVGDAIKKGQVIGRITLGSHAAIYPITSHSVKLGQHVLAGQTL